MWRWASVDRAAAGATLAGWFQRLDARELAHVRRCVGHTERHLLRRAAIVLNLLSNGMLYPLVAAAVLAAFGRVMFPAVLVSAGAVLVAHLIYPRIKGRCARRRPFECDPSIASLLKPLDRHSFPSGHAMTATAAFLPLAAAAPALAPLALAAVMAIGWARLAAGHHFLSDVLAGMLLGALIALPGLVWLLH